uniref:Uncharacterized protein n=1 Tax=viral metagenome TaxID=1070528 RepID=A0A6C0DR04_9ZZZZ
MNANAAARKRRAPPSINELPPPQQTRQNPNSPGGSAPQNALTLPQVINVIDKRLIALETFVKESNTVGPIVSNDSVSVIDDNTIQTIIQEFSARFDILAEEIGNLKDIVLKLQTYTMDVNKMLVDERIQILSDIDNQPSSNITLRENIKLEEMSVSSFELADEMISNSNTSDN